MKALSLAKITRPRLASVCQRDMLFHVMDQNDSPVTWISAPGGSGKTTAAISYLDSKNHICLWYQIDAGDADLASFFYYMELAARKAAPRFRKTLPLLTPEYLMNIPVFTRRFFEKLCAQLPQSCTLVFDNFQDVSGESGFHEMIAAGLEAIPDGMRVIIISRTDPPPQFARLLANNKIGILGWDHVKFSIEETAAFVNTVETQSPASRQFHDLRQIVSEIQKQTDGWVAGIVLMIKSSGTNAFETRIDTTNHESIFHYFASEIFNKAEIHIQDFLLKTAFLTDMTADMAQKMTGVSPSEKILIELNRNNYFCQRVSGKNPIYRYHPLFQNFLLKFAHERFMTDQLNEIRLRAAHILEQSGQVERSAELMLDAGRYDELVKLVFSHGQSFISEGRNKTIDGWITAMPRELLDNTPWLLYWLGACRLAYNPGEARGFLEKAFQLFQKNEDVSGLFVSCAFIMNSFIYEFENFRPLDHWITVADKLMADYRDFANDELKGQMTVGLLNAMIWRQPNHPEIHAYAKLVRQIIAQHPDFRVRMMLGNYLFLYYIWFQNFSEGKRLINELQSTIELKKVDPLTKLYWHVIHSMYFWIAAEGESCRQSVAQGIKISDESGILILNSHLLGQGVYGGVTLGDMESAATFLERMSTMQYPRLLDKAFYYNLSAAVSCAYGKFKKAIDDIRYALQISEEVGCPFTNALYQMELGLTLFDSGDHEAGFKYLALAMKNGKGMNSIEFMTLIHGARFAFFRGNEKEGLDLLNKGLTLGASQQYINVPRWNNQVISALCAKALEHNIQVDYAQWLIQNRQLLPPKDIVVSGNWPYPVKIITLGRFDLVINDVQVKFSGKVQQKPLAMLKLIIALGGKDIPETQTSDILWPDSDGDMAHNSFKVTLNRLRKILGDEKYIIVDGGKLSVNFDFVYIDIRALESIFKKSEKESPEKMSELANQAIHIFQGKFLQGEEYLLPVQNVQRELVRKMNRLLLQCFDNFAQKGQSESGLGYLEKALELDSASETVIQKLMRYHLDMGQKEEALKYYQQYIEKLNPDIEPSVKMRGLYEKLQTKTDYISDITTFKFL